MSENGTSKSSSSVTRKSFHFFAGLLSGLTTAILLQPADLLKTRLQQSAHHIKGTPLAPTTTSVSSSTLLSTIRSITSSPHPIRQLWRGTLPSAIRTGAGSALYFGGLDWMRGAVLARPGFGLIIPPTDISSSPSATQKNERARLTHTANLLTGALARATAGFVMMPITVIKVRYESSLYSYTSIRGAALDIVQKEGWRGFFAGFGATAVRDAPYAGLYVLFYEAGKRQLASLSALKRDGGSSVSVNFLSATLAATLSTAITNPFDAIKTRLQLHPATYRNTITAARMMLSQEGWRSMFDGLALRMLRKGLSSALAWTVYEELVRRAEIKLLDDGRARRKADAV